MAPYLPTALSKSLVLPSGFSQVDTPEEAILQLEVGGSYPVSTWVYALVAPFPTVTDGVSSQNLLNAWREDPGGVIAGLPLLMDESTYGVFAALWGEPSSESVQIVPSGELVDYAWNQRYSWAIVPFEALEPRWKVLEVDGVSPIRNDFDLDSYALTVMFSLNIDPNLVGDFLGLSGKEDLEPLELLSINRDPDKLTTLIMTGVTAMVRCTAYTMERYGVTYPAHDIGSWLRGADLTHISNEIPFVSDCPRPSCDQSGLRFCSYPGYIELMENVGTDIVELTGDHFADYGPEAMLLTLDLYDERDWVYYGGGSDKEDARQARIVEHNDNQLAFIGCNAKGGGYATASETRPGAVACDYEWMHKEISSLREAGYLVIATFQHIEYYAYAPKPEQVADFQGMAEAGAVIVSGSQAHQPQGMEFYDKTFIHYGLGNLFFDQYNQCQNSSCNDAFIDRHVFYDGRYISTEMLTIRFVDYARSRPMTSEERVNFLVTIFGASGW